LQWFYQVTERSFIGVWLAFIAGLLGLAAAFALMPSKPSGSLAFNLQTAASGTIKLYIDQGQGFNEADTTSVAVGPTNSARLVIPLPFARYISIRLDPDLLGGPFVISNPAITGDFGTKPLNIGPEVSSSFPVSVRGDTISGEVSSNSFDPQLILTAEPQLLARDTSVLRKLSPFVIPIATFIVVFVFALKLPLHRAASYVLLSAGFCLPFAVFFDLSLLGYWLVKPEWMPSIDRFGSLAPVADPAAGSYQDYPWLTYIGRSIAEGSLPIVNTLNGTGAPLLESLQSGVFYPLNVVLPLFDLSQPDFFGLFMLLHISILFGGCYLVAQRYCERKLAVVLSVSFSLAPLTFSTLNMVHFRAFVWMPYLVWSLIKIANRSDVASSIVIGAGAIAISLSAGNPQETVFGVIAALVIYLSEVVRTSRSIRLNDVPAPFITAVAGILIGLPSILPYFLGKADGGLASVQSVARSAAYIGWQWWPAVLIPSYQGVHPFVLRASTFHDEFALFSVAPTISFLIICTICVLCLSKKSRQDTIAFSLIAATVLFGFLQIFGGVPFNPIRFVPLLNTIRITKYINYLHLLLFFGSCLGCMLLQSVDKSTRMAAIKAAVVTVVLLTILAVVTAAQDEAYSVTMGKLRAVAPIWIGSGLAVLGTVLLLSSRQLSLGMLLVLISTITLRPFGFERGDVSAPHPSTFWDAPAKSGRILTRETANQNLISKYDSLTVFDPVLNTFFARAMADNFRVEAPEFSPRPVDSFLNKSQIAVLGLLGVTHLQGYIPSEEREAVPEAGGLKRLTRTLFPGVKVPLEVAQQAEAFCAAGDFSSALATLESAVLSRAESIQRETNSLVISFPRTAPVAAEKQVLIVPLAFSKTWTVAGDPGSVFCRYISRWDGMAAEGSLVRVAATPSSLKPAFVVSAITIVLVLVIALIVARGARLKSGM
jgi:hypothetical protein